MLHQALGIMQQPRSMKVDGSGAERAYMLHAQMFTSPSWLRKLLPILQLLRVAPWTVPHPVTVATLLGCDFPAWGNERVLICTPKSASDSPPRLDCRTRVLVQCLQKHAQLRFGKIICFADRAVHASDDSYMVVFCILATLREAQFAQTIVDHLQPFRQKPRTGLGHRVT